MMSSHRFQIALFLGITFVLSWVEQYFIISEGEQNPVRVFALMWTPGLVAILCARLFDKNLKSLAVLRTSWKVNLEAYLIPIVMSVLVVLLLIVFSIAPFQINPKILEKTQSLPLALFAVVIVAPLVGMIFAFISALGEEIGWRGFLHSRLATMAPVQRSLLIGMIWSLWHWPLILFNKPAVSEYPWINILCFTVAAISLSYLMDQLRVKTGSSIPAAVLHASHNIWILMIAPVFYSATPLATYFGGETGVFCALVYFAIASLRRRW